MTVFVVAAVLLSAGVLLPTLLLLRPAVPLPRGRRDSALRLHRAQLGELERDRGLGLLARDEHGAARLEVERRLLRAADTPDTAPATGAGRGLLLAAVLAIPLASAALYLLGGHPGWPADPLAPRLRDAARDDATGAAMADRLVAVLASMDPANPDWRAGKILLGNVDARRGRWEDAADAWRAALARRFDPALADETAEVDILAHAGRITDDDAALLRQAIAAAPAGAEWRLAAEARLAEYEHQKAPH